MARDNTPLSLDQQLKKNKLVALLTIFVTIGMPIAGFFSIPLPATKHDIAELHQADISIREDMVKTASDLNIRNIKTEIELLNMDEERFTGRKYENIRQQDEFRLVGKPVPAAYTLEQSDVESKLRHVEQELDLKKDELREWHRAANGSNNAH